MCIGHPFGASRIRMGGHPVRAAIVRGVSVWGAPLALAVACGPGAGKARGGGAEGAADLTAPGPWGVAVSSGAIAGSREIPYTLWAPAEGGAPDTALPALVPSDPRYADLLSEAPAACPSASAPGDPGAAPAAGPWPLLVASHCHGCTRANLATVAARLASHGVATVAVDHVGNTLWDELDGELLPLSPDTLELRVADLGAALDAALAGELGLDVRADAVGAMGHSFGSVTAGVLAARDARVRAVLGLAAPPENPLLPGVVVAELDVPLVLLLATEDNSITEVGNDLLRANHASAAGPGALVELVDAGHFSVSDLCGVVESFDAGCGEGLRQTAPGEAFTYMDAARGRELTARLATAFALEHLDGGRARVADLPPEADVRVELRR